MSRRRPPGGSTLGLTIVTKNDETFIDGRNTFTIRDILG